MQKSNVASEIVKEIAYQSIKEKDYSQDSLQQSDLSDLKSNLEVLKDQFFLLQMKRRKLES